MAFEGTHEGTFEDAFECLFEGCAGGGGLPIYAFTTEQTGSTVGYSAPGFYGSLSPTDFQGSDCTAVIATIAGNDRIRLQFDLGAQVPGVNQITITIAGAPEPSYVMNWNAGTLEYEDQDDARAIALRTYLVAEVGNTLDLTMQATG